MVTQERAGPGAPPPVHAAHAALDLVGAVALGAVHTTAAVLKAAHRAGGGERKWQGRAQPGRAGARAIPGQPKPREHRSQEAADGRGD